MKRKKEYLSCAARFVCNNKSFRDLCRSKGREYFYCKIKFVEFHKGSTRASRIDRLSPPPVESSNNVNKTLSRNISLE